MRWSRPKWMIRQLFQIFFISLLLILLIVGLLGFMYTFFPKKTYSSLLSNNANIIARQETKSDSFIFIPLSKALELNINRTTTKLIKSNNPLKCAFHTCFNIYRCGKLDQDRLSIYVYPIRKIIINGKLFQPHLSQEFYTLLSIIVRSPYYVSDPREACLFVPSIDLLNLQNLISSGVTMENILIILQSHEFWGENGENHILFTMFPGFNNLGSLNTAAIIASSGFKSEDYTLGFHIPVIAINPFRNHVQENILNSELKKFLLIITMKNAMFHQIRSPDILTLDICSHNLLNYSIRCRGNVAYNYPQILSKSEYCLVEDLAMPNLWDAMSVGCIPVIVPGDQRLPFDEFIDWKRNAIILYKHQLSSMVEILRNVSESRKLRILSQVRFTFSKYFRDMEHLTRTVLQVLKDRVFPHSGFSIHDWNENPMNAIKISPIFNPVIAPKTGFTAVILAYDRVESLFQVIEQIAHVPSLYKILVVWNNQIKKPPKADLWPRISKSLKIVQTQDNKMSNRFYPYEDIETEAILSLDDDIIMLTNDEIEFGYQTWREFSDRIVGFPSRTHTFDNITQKWKYESEWTNEISMVLTGAAFYHKYWHHAYFNEMPFEIRQWVDKKMNCEDIALNFLVSNRTGKPQIKVTPRKKFKCPTCINNEMLSKDTGHMLERTECINKFSKIYGYMPLIPIEFRADPVLFKVDHLPDKMKKYNDVGTI